MSSQAKTGVFSICGRNHIIVISTFRLACFCVRMSSEPRDTAGVEFCFFFACHMTFFLHHKGVSPTAPCYTLWFKPLFWVYRSWKEEFTKLAVTSSPPNCLTSVPQLVVNLPGSRTSSEWTHFENLRKNLKKGTRNQQIASSELLFCMTWDILRQHYCSYFRRVRSSCCSFRVIEKHGLSATTRVQTVADHRKLGISVSFCVKDGRWVLRKSIPSESLRICKDHYIIYLNQFLKSVLAGNPPNVWTDCYLHVLAFSEVKPSWFTVFSLIRT